MSLYILMYPTKAIVDKLMSQAQTFASAWSLVGTRFDNGDGITCAEEEKEILREMITTEISKLIKDNHEGN